MATNQIKVNDIAFNLDAINELQNIDELKAQGALEHLPERSRNSIYDEVWKQAQELKAKQESEPAKLSIKKR